MTELLIHPITKRQLDELLANPVHAVLLTAPPGSGKGTLARQLAAQLLHLTPEALATYPFFLPIEPAEQSIPIESVRQLIASISLKALGQGEIRRVAIIEQGGCLTAEAQNALLKLLEEPPADMVLIITAASPFSLLPTVRSRLRRITVQGVDQPTVHNHFKKQGFKETDVNRAFLISGGRVGLMSALLANDEDHPLLAAIDHAKQLLGQPAFARLTEVDSLSKHKEALPELFDALIRIARTALLQAAEKGQVKTIAQWQKAMERILEATEALPRNANTKLLLTNLFLNL